METVDLRSDVELVERILALMHSQIETADGKVHFLLAANALLAAALSFESQRTLPQLQIDGIAGWEWALIAASVVLLLSIVLSTLFSILTLLPRIRFGQERSLFFFSDIALMPSGQFIGEFRELTDDELYEQVLCQVHANAQIASQKFLWVRLSTIVLTGGLLSWVAVQVAQFFAS